MPSESQREALAEIVKHSLSVAGHRTCISLESAFSAELKRIANVRRQPLANLVAATDAGRGGTNLSSAIRVFVLNAARRSPWEKQIPAVPVFQDWTRGRKLRAIRNPVGGNLDFIAKFCSRQIPDSYLAAAPARVHSPKPSIVPKSFT